jgi:hypothetical protein
LHPDPASLGSIASVKVSDSIASLAHLLELALRDPPPPLMLRLAEPTAVASAPAVPHRFARALAHAVSGSGVFFESHLAEWARGQRDSLPLIAEAFSRAAALTSARQVESPASGDVAFRQQIASLITGELGFQFVAWAGQSATLLVGREPEPAPQAAAGERGYVARVDLDLPGLGAVGAILKLRPCGIEVDLRSPAPTAAALMSADRESLGQALSSAGLRVVRIEVDHERRA